ncbi:YeeE/YedE thiosulfate transporter family protein, partial [Rhizobium johnstonii]
MSSLASGSPNVWLLSFLLGIVGGGSLGGHRVSAVWVRGETPVRYLQLGTGGLLLGAGGWIAGGCNLGHGLSGLAQMNVSSIVV